MQRPIFLPVVVSAAGAPLALCARRFLTITRATDAGFVPARFADALLTVECRELNRSEDIKVMVLD